MDYYQILKLGHNASSKEIEQAYQRLIKESRYNTSIDKKLIEAAYRTLGDERAKRVYDQRRDVANQINVNREKKIDRQKKRLKDIEKKLTLPRLMQILGVLFLLAMTYYYFRFGYYLKSFEEGQVLYFKGTNQRYGRILKIVPEYDFGTAKVDSYLIETVDANQVYIPQTDIKARCYSP